MKKILINVILIFLMTNCKIGITQNYIISAKQKWVDTQIDLKQGQKISISSRGEWSNGGGNPQQTGPAGFAGLFLNSTLAPNLPLSALIGKINNSTFLIGEAFTGMTPTDGRLFLSMNDDDFSDNNGQLKVSVEAKPWVIMTASEFIRPTFFNISESQFKTWFQVFFSGGKVQLSQTGEGTPLTITSGGVSKNAMSYVAFGPTLNGFGVSDISVDLPKQEFSLDNIKNSGGFSVFGQYLLTHGLLFVDRFRFQVNNVHAVFDNDLEVSLRQNEFLLQLTLHAPDPAIRGEGNGYHPLFGLIPVPLGWQDGLCPDIAFDNLKIAIHLVPFIDSDQKLHFRDPTVTIESATLSISVLDWLSLADNIKNKAVESFRNSLEKELKKDKAKKGMETGVFSILPILTGHPNDKLTSIDVQNGSILVFYKK